LQIKKKGGEEIHLLLGGGAGELWEKRGVGGVKL